MKHEDLLDVNCPVMRSSAILGERWVIPILRAAFLRARTFEDFQRMTGVARNILTERLTRLVDFGVLERRPYEEAGRRVRNEYRLTEAGKDLYPVIVALIEWGTKHAGFVDGPPIELVHSCGAKAQPRLTCPDCGEPIRPQDMQAVPGPGAG